MKKSIIALAVLAAGFAQADGTTLYGKVEATYTFNEAKEPTKAHPEHDNSIVATDVELGVKGTDDLGNGLTAFYDFNVGKSQTEDAVIGVKGDFGTLAFGHNDLPTSTVGKFYNPHDDLGELDMAGFWGLDLAVDEADNTAAYISPNFNGLQFLGGVQFDGDAKHDGTGKRHGDVYDVAVNYDANGFYAGLGVQGVPGAKFKSATKVLGFGYGNDKFEVGYKTQFANKAKYGTFVVSGKYNVTPDASVFGSVYGPYKDFGDAHSLGLGYSQKFGNARAFAEYRLDKFGDDSFNNFAVGSDYQFSKQTKAWAKYTYNEIAPQGDNVTYANAANVNHFHEDQSVVELGLETNF